MFAEMNELIASFDKNMQKYVTPKRRKRKLPLFEILTKFDESYSLTYVYEYADVHYANMNSAQTSFAAAVKKYGFKMVVRTSGRSVVIFQQSLKPSRADNPGKYIKRVSFTRRS